MKNRFFGLALLVLGLVCSRSIVFANENEPIVVIALVKVKPGTERAFKEAAIKILDPTRKEDGNISYDFHQSLKDPTEFATVEKWNSEMDLSIHMKTPHMLSFFNEVRTMFEESYPQIKELKKFDE